jgi:hypothetical protein
LVALASLTFFTAPPAWEARAISGALAMLGVGVLMRSWRRPEPPLPEPTEQQSRQASRAVLIIAASIAALVLLFSLPRLLSGAGTPPISLLLPAASLLWLTLLGARGAHSTGSERWKRPSLHGPESNQT